MRRMRLGRLRRRMWSSRGESWWRFSGGFLWVLGECMIRGRKDGCFGLHWEERELYVVRRVVSSFPGLNRRRCQNLFPMRG
jgi:hypothetical protein